MAATAVDAFVVSSSATRVFNGAAAAEVTRGWGSSRCPSVAEAIIRRRRKSLLCCHPFAYQSGAMAFDFADGDAAEQVELARHSPALAA